MPYSVRSSAARLAVPQFSQFSRKGHDFKKPKIMMIQNVNWECIKVIADPFTFL